MSIFTLRLNALWISLLLLPAAAFSAFSQDTLGLYLSGRDKDDAVPWRFFCTTGAQSGFWTTLPVPSNWELHGFGRLNYRRDPTTPPPERGLYQLDFSIPQNWTGRRVFIVFEGVMTDAEVKINGQLAGPVHQGGFYRFKYEITPLLKFGGSNLLEVGVDKHSANASVNNAERNADYWVFGGIYRPVYLEAVPQSFIERVAIDARADGAFAMDVFVNGATNGDSLEAQITSLDGKPVGEPFVWKSLEAATNNPSVPSAILATKISAPRQWTAETPNLYSVQVRLKRGGELLHVFSQRFGFRTIEIRDGDGIYVNGRKTILRGVNRHSIWPDSGRCLSEKVHRMDIEAIKDMNGNAVRMSHYPPDAEFLDLCDELGLYVLDELAGWHRFYDTATGTKLVEEMVTRDVNHPSILFWDNGNEGGFNRNLDKLFAEFDPQQRRVLHPWESFNGFCTAHYLAFDKAEIAASGQSVYYSNNQELVATNDRTKYIYMPTEFMHGLYDGGAGAGLEDYWRMMMSHTNCAGGFIWALLDEGVKRVTNSISQANLSQMGTEAGTAANIFPPGRGQGRVLDLAGNQAPDGIVGPYREREGSFYSIKEIWSPIQIAPDKTGALFVENHFNHTDAAQCRFTWQLRKFPMPNDTNAAFTVITQGLAAVNSIPPGGRGPLNFKLPPEWKQADALAVRADDPSGRELWTWVWPMGRREILPAATGIAARVGEFGWDRPPVAELKHRDILVRINGENGELLSVSRGGKTFALRYGPRVAFSNSAITKIEWQLRADGWLQCNYSYYAHGTNDACGVVFAYPELLVKGKRWLGEGPYRVWKNRQTGGTFGVWQNDFNNTITGYRDWIYPEFKGCFADVRWLQLETMEGQITIVPENVPFVQVLKPEQPPENLVAKTKVNLPQCGFALLNSIPPIGTKFKEPDYSGPQSQPNVANNEYSGSVSFYFGKLP